MICHFEHEIKDVLFVIRCCREQSLYIYLHVFAASSRGIELAHHPTSHRISCPTCFPGALRFKYHSIHLNGLGLYGIELRHFIDQTKMAMAFRFHVRHALLIVLFYACKFSQQETPTNTSLSTLSRGGLSPVTIATPTAWVNSTRTNMPKLFRGVLPTVTIATPTAWVNPSVSDGSAMG